uniref:hypothetical protein n=1 Tax=Bacillus cytotoxicus TaxID=580165 RepID=UPI003EBF69C5
MEIGRIKGVRAKPGHYGIRYRTPKTPPIRSIEIHPNHNGHGIHIQRNVWTLNHPKHKGKLYRLGGEHTKRWGLRLAYQKLKGKFKKNNKMSLD